MEMEAEAGVMLPQTKEPGNQQKKPEEARNDSPLEPMERVWSSQHFDFRLLTSRTVKG